MTREYLSQYVFLGKLIEKTECKIKYYKNLKIHSEHGIVKGSRSCFPYSSAHFNVSGPNIKDVRDRNMKISQLIVDLSQQKETYETMKLEIELFIFSIADPSTKLMFTYWYIDGMKEEDVAKELNVERSTVHKRIYKYLEEPQLSHLSHI